MLAFFSEHSSAEHGIPIDNIFVNLIKAYIEEKIFLFLLTTYPPFLFFTYSIYMVLIFGGLSEKELYLLDFYLYG